MKTATALLLLIAMVDFQLATLAQGTAFTYQGLLSEDLSVVNGTYDFAFQLFDAPTGGNSKGGPISTNGVVLSDGLLTVTLDFGASPFSAGAPRWLEISVRTNGGGSFGILNPRQALTATPYAITAGNVIAGGIAAGTYTNAVTFINASNRFFGSFAGDGSALSNLNVSAVGVLNVWRLNGNAGTSAGANFLGTTDNQPLELRVNGQRALRIEPNMDGAPNIIGGAPVNFVGLGVAGATIGGGGATNFLGFFGAASNSVSSHFGTIAGGTENAIDVASTAATIGGGQHNAIGIGSGTSTIAGGGGNLIANSIDATIGGGVVNAIQENSEHATIAGGAGNRIAEDSPASTIGGGEFNTIPSSSYAGTIPGGINNTATNQAFAAGTDAKAVHDGAFVWADSQGGVFSSSAPNQFLIRAGGNVGINKTNPATALDVNGTVTASGFSVEGGLAPVPTSSSNLLNLLVGGGSLSSATNGSLNGISFYESAAVKAMSLGYDGSGGSSVNALRIYGSTDLPLVTFQNGGNVGIGTTTPASALHVRDTANAEISVESSDVGGHRWSLQSSRISGASTDASFQIVDRTIPSTRLFIGTNGNIGLGTTTPATALHVQHAGDTEISLQTSDSGAHRWTLQSSGVSGNNLATDASFQILDRTLGESRLFIGKNGNVGIGNTGPASALHVKASPVAEISIESLQGGAHRWGLIAYGPSSDPLYDASFQIIDRTENKVRLAIDKNNLCVIVGNLEVRGTIDSWSDRNAKTNFVGVDVAAVLERVTRLPISQWRFKTEDEQVKHIGPVAQDFRAAFGLGTRETAIATVDADGVALAAIQGLNQKVEERSKKLEDELKRRDIENAELKQRLEALEKLVRERF